MAAFSNLNQVYWSPYLEKYQTLDDMIDQARTERVIAYHDIFGGFRTWLKTKLSFKTVPTLDKTSLLPE